jgi:hypothetical protein
MDKVQKHNSFNINNTPLSESYRKQEVKPHAVIELGTGRFIHPEEAPVRIIKGGGWAPKGRVGCGNQEKIPPPFGLLFLC